MADLLPCVEVDPEGPLHGSVIWLHGLGADGHDFEPLVPHLGLSERGIRFVFPHAPRRPVTINMGMIMPAWYDIHELHPRRGYDLSDVAESVGQVRALMAREIEAGVAPERLVLAGFSQGGAIALHAGLRYEDRLAGILALSTYVISGELLDEEASAANRQTPIFQAHGAMDPMIPQSVAEQSRDLLQGLGYPIEWHSYPMGHEVHPEEIGHIGAWLRARYSFLE